MTPAPKPNDLTQKPCHCGGTMIEWITLSNPKLRHGWACIACGDYDQATGRERIVENPKA